MKHAFRWIRQCALGVCIPLLVATSVGAQESEENDGEDKIPRPQDRRKGPGIQTCRCFRKRANAQGAAQGE